MKRLATLLLAAGLLFGASQSASAVEFKGSGIFQVYFGWSNVENGEAFPHDPSSSKSDRFRPSQRVRLKLEMIANENLRGVFQIENDILWGQSASGGQLGGDGITVEVKHAYLDWVIPDTDIQVRMGLQPLVLPGMVADSAVLNDDVAGIVVSKTFNEYISATLFWLRTYADNTVNNEYGSNGILSSSSTLGGHDAADFVGLSLPMKFDGLNVTPWGMYGITGKNIGGWVEGTNNVYSMPTVNIGGQNLPLTGSPSGSFNMLPDANIWFAGITAELIAFDPFRFAVDFTYGDADTDAVYAPNSGAPTNYYAMKTKGYYVAAIAEYAFDMATPGLIGWYASGNDSDAQYKGGGMMPILNPQWAGTSFGFGDYYGSGNNSVEVMGSSPVGTWGGALQVKDLTFIEDMSHLIRVAYYTGTNKANTYNPNNSTASYSYNPTNTFLTEDDNVWEINFNTKYDIYENLALVLELGFLSADWDDTSWNVNRRDNAYRVNASFGYSF